MKWKLFANCWLMNIRRCTCVPFSAQTLEKICKENSHGYFFLIYSFASQSSLFSSLLDFCFLNQLYCTREFVSWFHFVCLVISQLGCYTYFFLFYMGCQYHCMYNFLVLFKVTFFEGTGIHLYIAWRVVIPSFKISPRCAICSLLT